MAVDKLYHSLLSCLTNAERSVTVNTIRLHMGTAHMACDPGKGIDMSKFSTSLRDAFEEAFQKEESREDFLREVFAALEDNRKVTLKGRPKEVEIKIELPEGGLERVAAIGIWCG